MADYSQGSNTGYNYDYSGEYGQVSRRVNGLEVILVLVVVVAMIASGIFGFFAGARENQDSQKSHDIEQIVKALDFFYANNTSYPIRQCSEDLNPIDFELSLKRNLTGKVPKIGTQNYIDGVFPKDMTGSYTSEYKNYIYNLPCPALVQESINKNGSIYADQTEACNYNRLPTKTQQNPDGKIAFRCYLYTSSINGDKYTLGYYSETAQRFVVISKFRTNKPELSYI